MSGACSSQPTGMHLRIGVGTHHLVGGNPAAAGKCRCRAGLRLVIGRARLLDVVDQEPLLAIADNGELGAPALGRRNFAGRVGEGRLDPPDDFGSKISLGMDVQARRVVAR